MSRTGRRWRIRDTIETGRDPDVTGEDALATQRVIDAIRNKGAD